MSKLLFMDIDGTLVDREMTISPRTKQLLQHLLDEKWAVYVATGRKYSAAREIADLVDPRMGVIASNGAVVSFGGQLQTTPLRPQVIESIYQIAQQQQLALFFFGLEKTFFVDQLPVYFSKEDQARLARGEESLFVQLDTVEKLRQATNEIINGIMIEEDDPEKLEATKAALEEIKELNVSSSHSNNLELIPGSISKATAIKIVQDHFSDTASEVIAFGDGNNDLEMLAAADISVAMGNAPENVKAAADHVTCSNVEDGIAVFMEKYLEQLSMKE